jgi:cytoskeleton protein RodZ
VTTYSAVQQEQLSKIGSYLKEAREGQSKSIEDVSLQTYIRPQLLKAIETGNANDLPQPIFVQGFIRRYAEVLGLDGMSLSKQFPVHSIPDTPRPYPQPATASSSLTSAPSPQTSSSWSSQSKTSADPPSVAQTPLNYASTGGAARSTAPAVDTPAVIPPVVEPDPILSSDVSAPVPAAAVNPITPPSPDALSTPTVQNTPAPIPSDKSPEAVSMSVVGTRTAESSSPVASWGTDVAAYQEKSSPNFWPYVLAGVLVAGILGAIALISNLAGGPKTEQAKPAPVETPAAQAPTPTPTPEPTPETPTATSNAPVSVRVKLTSESWMKVTVDGAVAFEGTMPAGTEELWEGQQRISVIAGNAGAVELSHNGSTPAPIGAPGAVETRVFTPDAPAAADGATPPAQ